MLTIVASSTTISCDTPSRAKTAQRLGSETDRGDGVLMDVLLGITGRTTLARIIYATGINPDPRMIGDHGKMGKSAL